MSILTVDVSRDGIMPGNPTTGDLKHISTLASGLSVRVEATVDLLKLAGLTPVGVIAEVVAEDGEMMRLPELLRFGREHGLPVTSIDQLSRAVWSVNSRLRN